MLGRVLAFLYGLICYLIFLISFLYAIAFVGNIGLVPKTIDSGPDVPLPRALIVNALLLSLFAIQHSVMARQWFKRAWKQIVPEPVERSTYVLLASVILLLLYWKWEPMKGIVWDVHNPNGRAVLIGLFWIGWGLVFLSTYLIDHFGLFGMKQVYNYLVGKHDEPPPFKTPDAIQNGAPPALPGIHHCVLVHTKHDRRTFVLRDHDHGIHFSRDPI